MGSLLPYGMLLTYKVDEVIETLPIPSHKRQRIERHLMLHAPTAYESPGIPLEAIWKNLPTDVQESLNEAAIEVFSGRSND